MSDVYAENKRLRDALFGIRVYGSDTISGPVGKQDDREWQRGGVLEMTKRARDALEYAPPHPSAEPDSEGWIAWHGGECPLPDDTDHEVKFRDGSVVRDEAPQTWDWSHDSSENIIAYRVIEPASDKHAELGLSEGENVCDTCEGEGTVDETLGGEFFSDPEAKCPDCDGAGWWADREPTDDGVLSGPDIRLFDGQWGNVVNHDDCYAGYSVEDAVAKAVALTEKAMAANYLDNSWPRARGDKS